MCVHWWSSSMHIILFYFSRNKVSAASSNSRRGAWDARSVFLCHLLTYPLLTFRSWTGTRLVPQKSTVADTTKTTHQPKNRASMQVMKTLPMRRPACPLLMGVRTILAPSLMTGRLAMWASLGLPSAMRRAMPWAPVNHQPSGLLVHRWCWPYLRRLWHMTALTRCMLNWSRLVWMVGLICSFCWCPSTLDVGDAHFSLNLNCADSKSQPAVSQVRTMPDMSACSSWRSSHATVKHTSTHTLDLSLTGLSLHSVAEHERVVGSGLLISACWHFSSTWCVHRSHVQQAPHSIPAWCVQAASCLLSWQILLFSSAWHLVWHCDCCVNYLGFAILFLTIFHYIWVMVLHTTIR